MEHTEIEINIKEPDITSIKNRIFKFKCNKCNSFPEITLFNSDKTVQIFSECNCKPPCISSLNKFIEDIVTDNKKNNKCQKCKNAASIKNCQLCSNNLCDQCYKEHLTIEHIINNKIIEEINKVDNFENINNQIIKEKMLNIQAYLKKIIDYYKIIENNFKKYMINNLNQILLLKLLLGAYNENKEEKLNNNIEFLLNPHNLEFKKEKFDEFLINDKNNILNGDRYKGEKFNEIFEGKGEMEYFNGIYKGQWKNGSREGFGIFNYKNGDKYLGYWKNNLKEGNG